MSATTLTSRAAGQRRGPGFRPRRTWLTLPATWAVLLVVLGLTLAPMLSVLIGGFRSTAQLNTDPAGLPSPWVWSNYRSVLTSATFWDALGNSVVISVVATGLAVGLGAMAALALSRYSFRGREGLFLVFAIGLLWPLNAAALPLYLLLDKLGMVDSILGLVLCEAAFALPLTVVILRPFMREIPGELEDAAVVDGASRLQFFLRVLLPLSRPALATVAVLAFINSWNQYLLPLLLFTSTDHYTLPLAVANFQTQFAQDTASILAFTALSMVPALACFIFAQRHLVGGFTGAVKG